jgi:glycosyltransferase involved in cell wall biosynthesis
MRLELSIVIPFYNEEDCVAQVVRHIDSVLKSSGLRYEIVAVQNGSRDRTGEILESLAETNRNLRIVEVNPNRGFGYGVLQGLATCDSEIVGYMPGDGQIDGAVLPEIVAKMRKTESEIGKGRRIERNEDWLRRTISFFFNHFARLLFQLPTDDVNSNPKLMTQRAYSLMRLCSHDFFIDTELLLKAQRLRMKFCEVGIVQTKREQGRSKVRIIRVCALFVVNMLKARFQKNDPWGINSLPLPEPIPSLNKKL